MLVRTTKRQLAPGQTRRAHTKSRSGCYSCKTRKIKCGEEKGTCRNCFSKDIDCEYPSLGAQREEMRSIQPPRLLPQSVLPTRPDALTFTDLRLFHHFLTVAYPHLPAGNDSVWTREIPKIAEHNEYLMHAMLGLGASHLYRADPQAQYNSSAIAHRGHAITGLNRAIAQVTLNQVEVDAMLATAYALTFQAQYMEDGLIDFMTMVRGCALITGSIRKTNQQSSFNLEPGAYVRRLEPGISKLPKIDKNTVQIGLDELSRLPPILQTQTDLHLFFSIKNALQACLISTKSGFIEFAKIYDMWHSTELFNELIDTNNNAAQILLSYFTAIQLLMSPVTWPMYKPPRRATDTKRDILLVFITWARKIFLEVPSKMRKFIVWPEAVVEQVHREISGRSGHLKLLIYFNDTNSTTKTC